MASKVEASTDMPAWALSNIATVRFSVDNYTSAVAAGAVE